MIEEYYCINCGRDMETTGLGECPECGADLRCANSLLEEKVPISKGEGNK